MTHLPAASRHNVTVRPSSLQWPAAAKTFFSTADPESFAISGRDGDRIDYLSRRGGEVWIGLPVWEALGWIAFTRISARRANPSRARSPAICCAGSRTPMSCWPPGVAGFADSARVSGAPRQPAHPAADRGLAQLAAGDLSTRVEPRRRRRNRSRHPGLQRYGRAASAEPPSAWFIYQMASWQTLARKMAHEVKNSLTPIRLTVEEMVARYGDAGPGVHGAGRADRGGRNREPGAPRARFLAIRRRAARGSRRRSIERAAGGTHRVSRRAAIPRWLTICRLDGGHPPLWPTRIW